MHHLNRSFRRNVVLILSIASMAFGGTNAYNEVLSKNRVNEVAKYMADSHPSFNAIKELDSKGETQLTNECGDGVECDPYAHFLNRRVEVWFY